MGLLPTSALIELGQHGCPQVVPHQVEAGQKDQAEPASSPVGPHEDRQQDQVQRQEASLAQNQAEDVNLGGSSPHCQQGGLRRLMQVLVSVSARSSAACCRRPLQIPLSFGSP